MGLHGQRVNNGFLEQRVRTAGSALAMRLACGAEKIQAAGVPGLVSLGLRGLDKLATGPQQAHLHHLQNQW